MAQSPASTEAEAESPPDWDLRDGDGFLMAVVVYNPGLIIGVRCRAWDLDAFISGLPVSADEWTRSLDTNTDGDDFSPSTWAVTTDPGTVFSLLPGRFARGLREGGPLQIRAQGSDGRRMRYVMELPSSPAAIDQVLTKCRKPLVDPQDAALEAAGQITTSPGPRDWARQPRPRYPDEGLGVTRGLATLSCVAAPTDS
ncbi:hypothetical protein ASG17_00250 [Brevundimonas sp. Leaf363]|uniref:hypothetical protein n=1 Tax=Brevundimonas sp. Leaf363 TaxID=1736353 RepID=UPI0006FDDD9E|nr:hypothetical protein [Brevundimonas sp. Leaf363]KQS57211.1 hypothetical protein ASG17_00250 [Brevundimonas sp. Leaf363]